MDDRACKKVYRYVSAIPEGKVTTYGRVAQACGLNSPRQVGKILHENKSPENVPCHRVVFSNGTVSDGYAFGGAEAQFNKLKKEGVVFKNKKVDFRKSLAVPAFTLM